MLWENGKEDGLQRWVKVSNILDFIGKVCYQFALEVTITYDSKE